MIKFTIALLFAQVLLAASMPQEARTSEINDHRALRIRPGVIGGVIAGSHNHRHNHNKDSTSNNQGISPRLH